LDLSGLTPGTEIDPDTYATAADRLEYALDGVGNRTSTTKVVSGTPTVTTYSQTPNGTLKDAEVNQYSSTQEDAMAPRNYTYDLNGNLTADGSRKYAYDFKNRLVEVRDQVSNSLVVQYSYDAFDRRGMKIPPSGTTDYLFDGIEVVEERDGSNAITRQYVWGNGIDQLLQEKTPTAMYSSHENSIGSVAALTDSSGTVVERYQYDPFGNITVTLDGSTGNHYRFQDIYFDDETGFYFMRARSYIPTLGRFAQRDPVGIWTDQVNLGNGYTFVGNDGANRRDPNGTDDQNPTMTSDMPQVPSGAPPPGTVPSTSQGSSSPSVAAPAPAQVGAVPQDEREKSLSELRKFLGQPPRPPTALDERVYRAKYKVQEKDDELWRKLIRNQPLKYQLTGEPWSEAFRREHVAVDEYNRAKQELEDALNDREKAEAKAAGRVPILYPRIEACRKPEKTGEKSSDAFEKLSEDLSEAQTAIFEASQNRQELKGAQSGAAAAIQAIGEAPEALVAD